MVRIKDEAEFGNLLNALASDIVSANIHWKLCKDIADAIGNNDAVFVESRTFWRLTMDAHAITAVQCLARAYDSQKDALHLSRWLKEIQRNLHFFNEENFRARLAGNVFVDSLAADTRVPDSDMLQADIDLCERQDADVKRLRTYRDNYAAHRNFEISKNGSKAVRPPDLTDPVVDTLMERAKTILNRYSDLFKATVHSSTAIGHDDFRIIFQYATEAIERRKQEIAEQLFQAGFAQNDAMDRRP